MKNNIKNLTIGLLTCITLLSTGSAFANTVALEKIQAYLNNDLRIVYNGKDVSLNNTPITYNGKTYLPLTDIGVLTNTSVKYNQKERSVEMIGNEEVKDSSSENIFSTIQDYITLDDGSYYALDVDGTIYVPLSGGSKKYGLFQRAMYDKGKGVYFVGDNKVFNVYTEPNKGYDAFIYRGNVFIKEDILKSIEKTPE